MMRWIGLAVAVVLAAPLAANADVVYVGAPAPVVSYYYTPTVSYYTPSPAVSYYVPAGPTVSTYRYGLFGRNSVTTYSYGAPVYYSSAPVVRSYYYAPPVVRSYYYAPPVYVYP
jgi:hypothetical protein